MVQLTIEDYLKTARFEGAEARDVDRLCGQILRVYDAIYGGQWLTLAEIAEVSDGCRRQ